MTLSRRVVILHYTPQPEDLSAIVQALQTKGAEVTTIECTEPYCAVLNAIAVADSVIVWR